MRISPTITIALVVATLAIVLSAWINHGAMEKCQWRHSFDVCFTTLNR